MSTATQKIVPSEALESATAYRVNAAAPCPICGRPDWCLAGDGWAICQRVESPQRWNDAGWFHRLDDNGGQRPGPVAVLPAPSPAKPSKRWATLGEAQAVLEKAPWAGDDLEASAMLTGDYGLDASGIPSTWKALKHKGQRWIVYPGYTPDGTIIAYKAKSLGRDARGKRRCTFLWGSGGAIFLDRRNQTIVIVGGEEKALAAWQAGAAALGLLNGEKPPSEEWLKWLAEQGRDVILAHDGDRAGSTANEATADALEEAGLSPEKISVVNWPDLQADYDVADLNDVVVQGGLQALGVFLEQAKPRPFKGLSIFTIDDVFSIELPSNDNILGDRLLATGETLGLAGQPGIGKSRLALQMALCSIQGLPWCGIPAHNYNLRWLIFSPENSARRTIHDLSAMLRGVSAQMRQRISERLFLHVPQNEADRFLNDPKGLLAMKQAVRHFKPDVVIYDPLVEFFQGDNENDALQMRETLQAISRVARSENSDAAMVIIHHARAGKAATRAAVGYDAANFGRGSKALFGHCRGFVNVALGAEEDPASLLVVPAKCNNGRLSDPSGVRLDPETMRYEVDPDFDLGRWKAETEGKRRPQKKCTTEHVLAVLADSGDEWMSYSELIEGVKTASGVEKSTASNRIKEAVQSGLVRKDAALYALAKS